MTVVYDAGALIAADRSHRITWADHRARLETGHVPVTTAPVVSQVVRGPQQVQLARFLKGCDVVPFAAGDARPVGLLAGASGVTDVVDVHVVLVAARRAAAIVTSDAGDLERVNNALPSPVSITRT